MLRLLPLLLLISSAGAQVPPIFPNRAATDADLFPIPPTGMIQASALANLTASIGATDSIIPVTQPNTFIPNSLIRIENEVIKISGVSGPTLVVASGGRGAGGTIARGHAKGQPVYSKYEGLHKNQTNAEIEAIETFLMGGGGPGSTVNWITGVTNKPFADVRSYVFAAQTPGGSLTAATPATVTMTPCPLGVNGSDTGHYLYVTGGPGAAETVLITGGSCTSGTSSGTLAFTPANNHSAGWAIQSATAGIQEAVCGLASAGGTVSIPPGAYTLNANVGYCGKSNAVIAGGAGASFSGSGALPASSNLNQTYFLSPNSSGAVVMRRPNLNSGNWLVFLPDGSLMDTTGDACQGLQGAVNYAQQHGDSLMVYGGGITPPGATPPSTSFNTITCSSTLQFPTGWQNQYQIFNIFLALNSGASDGITIDSSDTTQVDFHSSQLVYSGTAAAVHFNPTADNGESFAGFTSSNFWLAHVVCSVSALNPVPDGSKGTGVRISAPALGLALSNGNGLFTNVKLGVAEINGCATGLLIDNPGSPSTVNGNEFEFPIIHGQGTTPVTVGTSGAAANLIYGNKFRGAIQAASTTNGLVIWGGSTVGGDTYDVRVGGATNCLTFGSSAANNVLTVGFLGCTTQFLNNATAQTNHVFFSGPPSNANLSAGASPYVYQNKNLRPTTVFISGTMTDIEIAADCSTYASAGAPPTNSFYTLPVGACLRLTYGGAAPVLFTYF